MPFISKHGVDAIRNGFDECLKEGRRRLHAGLFHEFDHGELGGAVDGHELVELAFGSSDLCDVVVEEADRIRVELPGARLVSLDLGQAADAVTLQATMKGGAGELGDRGLESIKAVVERQQRVFAKRDDDGLLLNR